jgi:hypothetical protein
MKSKITSVLTIAALTVISFYTSAQSVFPGKETIDKKEFAGLTLSQGIPDKYLSTYWEDYLAKFGKVKGKKGLYTIEKAAVTILSPNPVQITSQVASVNKVLSKVFIALKVDGNFVTKENDQIYRTAENILKDFSEYAAMREEVRVADEAFTNTEKAYQKLQRDMEDKTKEIEKSEKKLIELRAELEKSKTDSQTSLLDLQNRQKALEAAKIKVPNLK